MLLLGMQTSTSSIDDNFGTIKIKEPQPFDMAVSLLRVYPSAVIESMQNVNTSHCNLGS